MNSSALSFDDVAEMAIAVLRATHDGDDLAPRDLKLIELAVNNRLNVDGRVLFQQLYENATKSDGYTVPYLFGIEHLTIDQQRYVRWKGYVVEHFDHGLWRRPGWREKMRRDAAELAIICRNLDAKGIQPTLAAVLERH